MLLLFCSFLVAAEPGVILAPTSPLAGAYARGRGSSDSHSFCSNVAGPGQHVQSSPTLPGNVPIVASQQEGANVQLNYDCPNSVSTTAGQVTMQGHGNASSDDHVTAPQPQQAGSAGSAVRLNSV